MFKLIKYELKSIWKFFVFVFSLWILYGLFFSIAITVLKKLGDMGDLILLIMGITTIPTIFFFMSFILFGMPIIAAIRFKKAYYSDKAHLFVPLPLSAHSHLLSRIILSIILTALSFAIYLFGFSFAEVFAGGEIRFLETETIIAFAELTIILCYVYLHLYTAVIVGHSFKKCRTLLSIAFYFVTWILSVAFLVFAGQYLKSSSILPPSVIVFGLITGAVYYIIAVWLFKRKLNVV